MTALTQETIHNVLKNYIDPYLQKDLVSAKCIKNISISDNNVTVDVELGFPCQSHQTALVNSISNKIKELSDVGNVNVILHHRVISHATQRGVEHIKGVKNIIAVASGKGGVGKSTVAVNLALALVGEGATVGILDADIYGPSQPRMLGVREEKPNSQDGHSLEPIESLGLQAMSIGFLIDEETPMIWRGPMVTQALEQLLRDTQWRDLDYLIIDLPPGTGDTQLTLAQKIPVSGAVIVTTPQDISLIDARKGLKMFEKVQVPVLGVIENMSIHICSNCGHEEHIFGTGGGERLADEQHVDFIGSLPLDKQIREDADGGKPTVAANPQSRISQIYRDIALRTVAKLSQQAKDFSARFPTIKIVSN
jgi:ATP-binding protein involved in chromosome partitioning